VKVCWAWRRVWPPVQRQVVALRVALRLLEQLRLAVVIGCNVRRVRLSAWADPAASFRLIK
jgi:hypothetical protein